jgi:parallel beta-helix repeat protein
MITFRHLLATGLMLGSLCVPSGNARAAQSLDTCIGFIDSVPTTISTPGVWCLRHDVSTSVSTGSAINIAANNVTIDCNDFKIGGLGAGNASGAIGIYANSRQNATVRHCNVRGFQRGIWLNGGAGHLIEDNRLDNNLNRGITVYGENNRVQRNRVYDTGGLPGSPDSFAIVVYGDVIDNTVAGVFATNATSDTYGITAYANGSEVRGNRVRGLVVTGGGTAIGIYSVDAGVTLADNRVSAATVTSGAGIYGSGSNTFCVGNTVVNFSTAYAGCGASDGNLSLP